MHQQLPSTVSIAPVQASQLESLSMDMKALAPKTQPILSSFFTSFHQLMCNIITSDCLVTLWGLVVFGAHMPDPPPYKPRNLESIGWFHLYLPISIFFLSAFCPWYMNESMMPATVKIPPTIAHRFVR